MAAARAYLDYNATAPLLDVARDAMLAALDVAGNPSSVHQEGRAARRIIDVSRTHVAALVGAAAENVVFTSGATEAASTLLTPHWQFGRAPLAMSRLYVCAADHPCTLSGGRFTPDQVVRIGVDAQGVILLDELSDALAVHDGSEGRPLVAVHLANNETGVIQPVAEIAALVKGAGGVLVVDAVQAVGRLPLDISSGTADFLILSAHKLGGPKGVGAFVSASTLLMPVPLVRGGGQEKGHRAGTENVPGIAGFGAAAEAAAKALDTMADVRRLRDTAEAALRDLAPDVVIYGAGAERLPNTFLFTIPGLKAETALIGLDLAGVSVSTGSACSSGKVGASHVLEAMGSAGAEGALRVSIGTATTTAEIDRFLASLRGLLARRTTMSVASAA